MRVCTFVFAALALALLLASARHFTTADEPGSSPPQALDKNDPLLKALQKLQREIDDVRGEMMPPVPAPKRAPRPDGSTLAVTAASPRPEPPAPSNHWSFQPLRRPQLPAVKNATWVRDDLDRFILARLEAAGVSPNAEADRHTLLRRVAFDLTGLPPSEEDVVASSVSPRLPLPASSAYEVFIDRLLASPRFGERWGRHWLDVVRYADSVGRTWNAPFTYAWRYRDYVIDAFNADLPYDRFITEQLAGDLLPAAGDDQRRRQLIATGLLGLGSMELAGKAGEAFTLDQIDDQIDVTSRAFLGLTISCARCHDHKYDPVTMHDYYALAGIFYSTETLTGQARAGNIGRNGYVDADQLLQLPSARADKLARLQANQPVVHSMSDFQRLWSDGRRDIRYTTDPNLAMGTADGEPRDCPLRLRGEPYDRGPAPPRGDLRLPSLPRLPPIPPGSSGRLELARWVASAENSLTARVIVNRVWQHLFGRGLVRTVDDFGSTGEAPTHPELLDHLAARFVADGWAVKRLIRSIVLSRTYQLSSAGNTAAEQMDPDNGLYWRMNLRRLELEPLRDSMLLAAGRLQFDRPESIQVAGIGGKSNLSQARSLLDINAPYRTVYLPVLRSLLPDAYGTFDFPDPSQIQGQRDVTTVAPQALFLMNGRFASDCARHAAGLMLKVRNLDDSGRVRLAYRRLLSREPNAPETRDALAFLDSLEPNRDERDPQLYRWSALIQAIMCSAEFRYVR